MAWIRTRVSRAMCIPGPSFMAVALLIALLPTLTYLGHWELVLPLPGVHEEVHLFGEHAHDHSHAAGEHQEHDHSQHCHGDAASCSDVPLTAASGFALLNEAAALLGAAGLALFAFARAWRPHGQVAASPRRRPPRRVSFANAISTAAQAV